MKKRVQEIKTQMEKENCFNPDNTFWEIFDNCYPPKCWDNELEKLPEKFQKAYQEQGISLLFDSTSLGISQNFLPHEYILPGGFSEYTLYKESYNVSEEEIEEAYDACYDFVVAIERAVENEVCNHPEFVAFCDALEQFQEEYIEYPGLN